MAFSALDVVFGTLTTGAIDFLVKILAAMAAQTVTIKRVSGEQLRRFHAHFE